MSCAHETWTVEAAVVVHPLWIAPQPVFYQLTLTAQCAACAQPLLYKLPPATPGYFQDIGMDRATAGTVWLTGYVPEVTGEDG